MCRLEKQRGEGASALALRFGAASVEEEEQQERVGGGGGASTGKKVFRHPPQQSIGGDVCIQDLCGLWVRQSSETRPAAGGS